MRCLVWSPGRLVVLSFLLRAGFIAIRVVLLSSPVIWKRLLVEAPCGGHMLGFFDDEEFDVI